MNRQYLPKFYKPNGAVYIVDRDYFIKRKTFVAKKLSFYLMPEKRSVNLDTLDDLILLNNAIKN
tara:strand:- start:722 stop:913 length:192 start_codon:yes stop_codon:yes gene_type:complete